MRVGNNHDFSIHIRWELVIALATMTIGCTSTETDQQDCCVADAGSSDVCTGPECPSDTGGDADTQTGDADAQTGDADAQTDDVDAHSTDVDAHSTDVDAGSVDTDTEGDPPDHLESLPTAPVLVEVEGTPEAADFDCDKVPVVSTDQERSVFGQFQWCEDVAEFVSDECPGKGYNTFEIYENFDWSSDPVLWHVTGAFGYIDLSLPVDTSNRQHWISPPWEESPHSDWGRVSNLHLHPQAIPELDETEFDYYQEFIIVRAAVVEEFRSNVDVDQSTDAGLVLGRVLDCDDRWVEHAVVTLTSQSTQPECPGGDEISIHYFSEEDDESISLPVSSDDRWETNAHGLYFIPEIAESTQCDYTMEAWGFLSEEGKASGIDGLTRLTQFDVQLEGGITHILDLFAHGWKEEAD